MKVLFRVSSAVLSAMMVVVMVVHGGMNSCDAFTTAVTAHTSYHNGIHRGSITALMGKRDSSDADGAENDLPQLPALGAASLSSTNRSLDGDCLSTEVESTSTTSSNKPMNSTSTTAFVSPKFELQYTCNVCETRNRVIVNRMAYREGMVIAICKGCDAKHWIADNLDPTLTSNNIEEYFAEAGAAAANGQDGDTDDNAAPPQVNRVTQEVYDIERVWQFKSGEIQDEDGNPVLE